MNNGNGTEIERKPKNLWRSFMPQSIRRVRVQTPEALNECWPWVKKRLEIIKKKDPTAGNWIPEHVRNYVLAGIFNQSRVELWIALDENSVIHGFIVLEALIDPYLGIPLKLHVWVTWANKGIMKDSLSWLEGQARERGLTSIQFITGRGMAWLAAISKMPESGFILKQMVFEKVIV